MAGSSSANDNTSSTLMLKIKGNQTLIIDLNSSHYSETVRPMIECLKFSPIATALTASATVPISLLSAAYSTAFYNKAEEHVSFEVGSIKTKISKSRFSKLLGFSKTKDLVDPESLQPVALQRLFHQMGYKGDITQLSKFSKKGLPPLWNALFTILFKSFSERTTGTDSASKLFYSIFYGLYNAVNLDYGSILWSQFVESVNYKLRHQEISCARFWSLVVERTIQKHDIHVMKDSVMEVIPTMPTATFTTSKAEDFEFIGAIPMTMLNRVPKDTPCIVEYCKSTTFEVRNIDDTHLQAFEKLENPKKSIKRKAKSASSDTEKQPKRSRRSKKTVMQPHSEDEHSDDNEQHDQRPPSPTPEHSPKQHTPPPSPPKQPTPPPSPPKQPTPPKSPPLQQTPSPKQPNKSPKHHSPNPNKPSPTKSTPKSPSFREPTSEQEDEEILIYEEQDEFADFIESPFNVNFQGSASSSPMSEEQFQELSTKLDKLLETQQGPSFSDWQSQLETHKSQVETLISTNAKLVEDFSSSMDKAKTSMEENAKKIVTLEQQVLEFMEAFTDSSNNWVEKVQKVINGFAETLKAEKVATAAVRSEILKDNSDLSSTLQSKIDKLREDLASENELMDLVASKTTKIQLLKTRLQNTNAVLSSSISKSHAVRNCVNKIETFIRRMVEDEDPVLTPYLRGHITNKLHPVFLLLSKIQGVSEDVAVPKQGGEDDKSDKDESDNGHEKPKGNEDTEKPKGDKPEENAEKETNNENTGVSKQDKGEGKKKASESPINKPKLTTITNLKEPGTQGSADDSQEPKEDWFKRMNMGDNSAGPSKRKSKKIGDDDVDEGLDMSEAAQLARAAREKELDEILRISKQLDAEEAAQRQREIELEARKTLFHDWDYEKMKKEAITQPIDNWLQPVCSYDIGNHIDSQMDFPMTSRVFLIRCFDELKTTKECRSAINNMLFNFYLEHSKPQYMSWNLKKIIKLTPRLPHVVSPFRNAKFFARRGSDEEKDEFTLADLPFMNPFDWVSLFNILSRREDHAILHEHVKKLLMGYILEISNLDVEVASVLNTVPKFSAEPPPSDINKRRFSKIKKGDGNVAYPSKEGSDSVKRIFYLRDKHLYRTPALKKILDLVNNTKLNTENDKRCFNDMLTWYISFRKRILLLIPRVFEKVKKDVKPEE
ncbi:hypothetical protein L1887_17749 [Cichorium endivia]|nr:hypothetical protein L1887_17749 [Cichorium endivia]